jgi:uncharacterized phage infection (PIP) family protein YhgE
MTYPHTTYAELMGTFSGGATVNEAEQLVTTLTGVADELGKLSTQATTLTSDLEAKQAKLAEGTGHIQSGKSALNQPEIISPGHAAMRRVLGIIGLAEKSADDSKAGFAGAAKTVEEQKTSIAGVQDGATTDATKLAGVKDAVDALASSAKTSRGIIDRIY